MKYAILMPCNNLQNGKCKEWHNRGIRWFCPVKKRIFRLPSKGWPAENLFTWAMHISAHWGCEIGTISSSRHHHPVGGGQESLPRSSKSGWALGQQGRWNTCSMWWDQHVQMAGDRAGHSPQALHNLTSYKTFCSEGQKWPSKTSGRKTWAFTPAMSQTLME